LATVEVRPAGTSAKPVFTMILSSSSTSCISPKSAGNVRESRALNLKAT